MLLWRLQHENVCSKNEEADDMDNLTQNSKHLAYLLRHSDWPDHNGWVEVGVLLNELHISLQMLRLIVEEDNKGRFEFSVDESCVRALYGHTADVDLELVPAIPPAILYHGTAEKYLDSIMKIGLKARKRKYVHLSETIEMAMQVGARHGSPIILSVDTESMLQKGYKYYKAQKGIWQTNEIPARFLKVVCYE